MTTASQMDCAPKRWVYIGFYATAIIFNLCLVAQLITVGVAYFVNPEWWTVHVWLVRGYGSLSIALLGWAIVDPLSRKIRSLAISSPALLGLQFASIYLKTPLHLETLHPLIGFALLYVSSSLVHELGRSLSSSSDQNEQLKR